MLVFAPGPDLKAVAAKLAPAVDAWASRASPAARRSLADLTDAVEAVVNWAQTALHTPIVLLRAPALTPLP